MQKTVYVGHILNDQCNTKTLVLAESVDEAKAQVIEKFKEDLNVYFQEKDIRIYLFSEHR